MKLPWYIKSKIIDGKLYFKYNLLWIIWQRIKYKIPKVRIRRKEYKRTACRYLKSQKYFWAQRGRWLIIIKL